ncbi:MAG: GNAT family N-acetyltransferase [Acidimicrobiales bacterium]
MSRASITVRQAATDDVGAVAELLTDAFADYVWTTWAVPADDHRRRLHTIYAVHSAIGAHRGDLWVLEVDGEIRSAAAWSLLDGAAVPSMDAYRGVPDELIERVSALADVFGDRLPAVQRAEAATLVARPSGAYWFLDCVGTAPAAQGQGFGHRLLTSVLDQLDADRLPTALETSTESNVRRYEKLGFAVTATLDVGDGAPTVWVMTRPPRVP